MTTAILDKEEASSIKQIPKPKGHWLTGNLAEIKATSFHLFLYRHAALLGDVFRVRILNKSMVVLSNPKTVQFLLKERPQRFRRVNKMEVIFKEMGIHGVFSAEGESWRSQRALMNPAFKPSQIKRFLPTIHKCAQQLCDSFENNLTANDIQKSLMAYTVNITSTLAFGVDLKTLQEDDPQFQKHLNTIFPLISFRVHSPFAYWRLFKLQRDREFDISFEYIHRAINRFIELSRKNIQAQIENGSEVVPENILEAMIIAQIKGTSFSEDELVANVLTLLLAGEDTTANTLAWTIHFLADRPDLQEQIFAEIQQSYPQMDTSNLECPFTMEDLENYPLTFAAAQEAMRLRPVAPHLLLEAYADEVLEGYKIPKGTMLVALLAYNGLKEAIFPNADRFDPARWLNLSAANKKQHASELMPFGFGARLCPGRQLSFVEMKISLIELLRKYKFTRNNSAGAVKERLEFTVVPVNLRVDIEARGD